MKKYCTIITVLFYSLICFRTFATQFVFKEKLVDHSLRFAREGTIGKISTKNSKNYVVSIYDEPSDMLIIKNKNGEVIYSAKSGDIEDYAISDNVIVLLVYYTVFASKTCLGKNFHNLLCITFPEDIPKVLEIKNIVKDEFLITEKLTCAGVDAIGDIAEDEKSVEIYVPTYDAKTIKPGQDYDFWKVQYHFLNKP